ncbi:MAG: bifunctional 4-hydroxy-2-oxoglutarate aldolase/2-dehydro-3-deoxy-phosphogluconate aldolase [Chloroflexi bacterium]|nr:bifunctional 4-hydroxy-2-oxoglutarate aldolase/2-dehydro-3-deoxy-phosphogluconate aldolase [Chloroflexota bacterium]
MDSSSALKAINASGIVAGMRGAFPPAVALGVADVLMNEGIHVFELMMNSEAPIEAMRALKTEFGAEACVGMGTVLDVETAHAVMDAGADFVVSPAFQPAVVRAVMERGVLMGPGAATPSEALAAWDMGAPLIKLFPIGALGVDYFRAIFGPLNHMAFMCNGALNDQNAREFILAGAVACGMGPWLVGDGAWSKSQLRSRARILVNAVESARGE